MKSKVRWKPIKEEPEVPLAECFVVHPSGHFRKPVVEGAKEREENPPHNDIVEMRDNEVGVAQLPVERCSGKHDSGQARNQELKQEPDAEKHRGVAKWIFPPHMVPIQLKIFIPVGIPTTIVVRVKKALA